MTHVRRRKSITPQMLSRHVMNTPSTQFILYALPFGAADSFCDAEISYFAARNVLPM